MGPELDRSVEPNVLRQEQIRCVVEDCRQRRASGESIADESLIDAHPDLMPDLAHQLRSLDSNDESNTSCRTSDAKLSTQSIDDEREAEETPKQIGRYLVRKTLGRGAFGFVYLAHDPDLNRNVAVKVPNKRLLQSGFSLDAFLHEARSAAILNHPHIVTIHDIQRGQDRPFIVQEYIEGCDLREWIRDRHLDAEALVNLLIEIAGAVGFAHQHRLLHRDIKPSNILVDRLGQVYVADFGLAVHESNLSGRSGEISGTPNYMSPEQVRGETHHLDARTDIWSMGVLMYELVLRKHPFRGQSRDKLFDAILTQEPQPPREVKPDLPVELERICLKCLEKRRGDRYRSTEGLIDDLQYWLTTLNELPSKTTSSLSTIDSASPVGHIVPKGLHAFGQADSAFYFELLPGPRDRDGLPESIRFWKSRIEHTAPDETFNVGVVYGPSGCGKTSLVNAGLLPRLGQQIVVVYVEANAVNTEQRLLKKLANCIPDINAEDTLPNALRRLRETRRHDRKVLIVMDQFEQWLHAQNGRFESSNSNSQLIDALRQCDGQNVQCIVMVRDEFWLAVSRLMRELEIRLVEGENCRLVDTFDLGHARKVLQLFGHAYGRLNEGNGAIGPKQAVFVEQSVQALAEDGSVAGVRLALFAEMMKDKPWSPSTLKKVGGIQGVGATFLEETFSKSTAPAEHRMHQNAARAVLKELLPQSEASIKGCMRSQSQLLDASGYSGRPDDFQRLIQILDRDVRLMTPTDPEGLADEEMSQARPEGSYYQLTHDYLVPVLREWLNRKQTETYRGRAELRLAERASLWNSKRERRRLPSWWEYLNIRLLTRASLWSVPERCMMRHARGLHTQRAILLCIMLVLIGYVSYETHGWFQGRAFVDNLMNAKADAIPGLISHGHKYRRWAFPRLNHWLQNEPATEDERRAQLHARLALVAHFDSHAPRLMEELLRADVDYLPVIRDALVSNQSRIVDELWQSLRHPEKSAVRFRAALALATFAPTSKKWRNEDLNFVADELVSANPDDQSRLREYLKPIGVRLLNGLERSFVDTRVGERKQISAANAIADFGRNDIEKLSRLLSEATPEQTEILFPIVEGSEAAAAKYLQAIVDRRPVDEWSPLKRVAFGRRRANAAIALVRLLRREELFEAFRVDDDPESLTQFVHRCRQLGVTPDALLDCLQRADALRRSKSGQKRRVEDRVLFGLLLALGEFRPEDFSKGDRDDLILKIIDWYANDPSSAIHGATGWLLRDWGCEKQARQIDETPMPYDPDREWFTLEIKSNHQGKQSPQSFFMTFVVFNPGRYVIGSPRNEPMRQPDHIRNRKTLHDNELLHTVRFSRPFAILDREIVGGEFDVFGEPSTETIQSPTPEHPVTRCNWYHAVRFCRALGEKNGVSEDQQPYPNPSSLDANEYPPDPDERSDGAPREWPLHLERFGFRLPTESEWEVACRASMRTAFSFGGDQLLLSHYVWWNMNSGEKQQLPRQKRPNFRGLFDMHGNAQEWTHDWLYYFPSNEAVDPMGPRTDTDRVCRGGGFKFGGGLLRSAARGSENPSDRGSFLGFRIAMTLPTEPDLKQQSKQVAASTPTLQKRISSMGSWPVCGNSVIPIAIDVQTSRNVSSGNNMANSDLGLFCTGQGPMLRLVSATTGSTDVQP